MKIQHVSIILKTHIVQLHFYFFQFEPQLQHLLRPLHRVVLLQSQLLARQGRLVVQALVLVEASLCPASLVVVRTQACDLYEVDDVDNDEK